VGLCCSVATHLTIHSSRRRFAARLNSGVRRHLTAVGCTPKEEHSMTTVFVLIGIAILIAIVLKASTSSASEERGARLVADASGESDKDDWEGSFWEVSQPVPAKARLRLDYTDGAGKRTTRTVDVRQFGSMGPYSLLIAHCHMRDATRTFRTDRIRTCIDVETGEVISNVSAFLQEQYERSPERTKEVFLEAEFDVLRILLFVGKADGQLRAAEKAIIREVCMALANDSRITDEMIDESIRYMDVPTLQAFKLAAGRIAKRDESSRSTVMAAAERIVATQKAVHPAEADAIAYLRKRLGGIATDDA
jgi:hypothetical protein